MVLQSHVANKNHHTSIAKVSMSTKLGRMIAALDGLLPIVPHDPCEIQGSLAGGGSAWKRLSRHRLLVRILCRMDIYFKRLVIYRGITMNISNT